MQALFYMDMLRDHSEERLALFIRNFSDTKAAQPDHEDPVITDRTARFFRKLVDGVRHRLARIDPLIEAHSNNWKLSRMSGVDRNVMRVAVYELLHCEDIPENVSINEAIDIGKRFGAPESGAFVNGILDSIRISRKGADAWQDPDVVSPEKKRSKS